MELGFARLFANLFLAMILPAFVSEALDRTARDRSGVSCRVTV
jgi:hypothetical protein